MCSILVHIGLLAVVLSSEHWPRSGAVPAPPIIEVAYVPQSRAMEQNRETRQIVTPPEKSSATPSDLPKKLSDIDSNAPREQIRRGDRPDADAVVKGKPSPPRSSSRPSGPKSVPEPRPKRLQHLKLDQSTLQSQFGAQPAPSTEERAKEALGGSLGNLSGHRPFSRAQGSGAQILGTRGSPDFLPSLPDGDITLLNTKANQFAVFVRRVALQVFSQLRASGWESLRAADIQNIRSDVVVRAILSPKGDLISVSVESASGSERFDAVVASSVQSGARDPNPPPGAEASDGNIHFIFKSKSWTRLYPGGRDGPPGERRWLLLATGLE